MRNTVIVIISLFTLSFCAWGQSAKKYSLFDPVPGQLMRKMETDRPDITESPQTIDAGHFQYESDLFRLEKQHDNSSKENIYYLNKANLKLGLSASTAIQLVIESFVFDAKKTDDQSKEIKRGIGDLTLRFKKNVLGNDHGHFALAFIPYLKFPTSRANEESAYEGGLIVPMSYKFGKDWQLGTQLEVDRLQDQEGNGHHNELLQTLTLSHPILKKLDGIGETFYTFDLKEKHWRNFLNLALQAELRKDIKLDAGITYAIQHYANQSYFLGLSFRL